MDVHTSSLLPHWAQVHSIMPAHLHNPKRLKRPWQRVNYESAYGWCILKVTAYRGDLCTDCHAHCKPQKKKRFYPFEIEGHGLFDMPGVTWVFTRRNEKSLKKHMQVNILILGKIWFSIHRNCEGKKAHQFQLLCKKVYTQLSVCFKKEQSNTNNNNNKTVRRNKCCRSTKLSSGWGRQKRIIIFEKFWNSSWDKSKPTTPSKPLSSVREVTTPTIKSQLDLLQNFPQLSSISINKQD